MLNTDVGKEQWATACCITVRSMSLIQHETLLFIGISVVWGAGISFSHATIERLRDAAAGSSFHRN